MATSMPGENRSGRAGKAFPPNFFRDGLEIVTKDANPEMRRKAEQELGRRGLKVR